MQIFLPLDADTLLPEVFEHQPVEFICAAGEPLTLALDGRTLEAFLRPGDSAWHWRWNAGAAVGVRALRLTSAGSDYTWRLRVVPAKIDQERYALLLDDTERLAAGLAFSLAGAATERAVSATEPERRAGLAEQYYALFAEQLDALERAVRQIMARPREQLRRLPHEARLGDPSPPAADALSRIVRGELQPAPPGVAEELQRALRPEGGLLPASLPAARGVPSADFYEHRLLKRLLELLSTRARRIGALAERVAARLEQAEPNAPRTVRLRAIANGCAEATRRLRELRAAPLLAEVGALPAFRGPTPLLQRDPAYRQVYRTWLALHRSPLVTVTSPLFDLPIADLPRLYESWCALVVAQSLLELGELREQNLLASNAPDGAPDDLEHTIALADDAPLLRVRRGDTLLTLRYQPRYRPLRSTHGPPRQTETRAQLGSLDRHTRVPDLAIEIEQPGLPLRVLVLDAKYRVEGDSGLPQDALAEAYAYLGSIGANGVPATCGAVILFPGRGAPEWYPSKTGALPLLPGVTAQLGAQLATWLAGESKNELASP
jgi:large subunit ribosomal protein MRP49